MKMKNWSLLCTITCLLIANSSLAKDRPNIILIVVDDMGYSDIGCYGGEIKTPHIDRLANEGLRFRQFYNNSKCTTTRTSIMSGCYPYRADKQSYYFWDKQTYCIAQSMKDAGYYTIQIGKWHVGPGDPDVWGFDDYFGKVFPCSYFDPTYHPDYAKPFLHN
ncbi:MAG: sulfatase-like hydrolase/transferase [Phycisphaerae bacterium]|nr:sulfatase-like hydrolase/transferase [Phycisphaerae bacterium]